MDPTSAAGPLGTPDGLLRELRRRADEDYLEPAADHERGRHTADVGELGLRVTITRSRYPNRADGRDLYAVTVSRIGLDGAPADVAVRRALVAAFGGDGADAAEPRSGGAAVRMFRVPAEAVS